MQPGHEPIDHTADVGFRAWGRTLEELFEQAALALLEVVCDRSTVEPRCERAIEANADPGDREGLLVAWLEEINWQIQARGEVYAEAQVRRLDLEVGRIEGVVRGEPIDPQRHALETEVKGVTWHELAVREVPGGFEAQVILDV
ncbi:MAG: archease [Planctomycetota bacterium]|nr:MAG: archease [Planctomycetota bacterium]